jgi:hypothetical protein
LRAKLPSRLRLSDPERAALAELGRRLAARGCKRSPASPSPTLFWPGTDDSSPRNSMPPNVGSIRAAPQFSRKWQPLWWEWRERTRAGDVTASLERWPTWVTEFRGRFFEGAYLSSRAGSRARASEGGQEFCNHSGVGRDQGFLVSRSPAHVRELVHGERRGPVRTGQDFRPCKHQGDRTLRQTRQDSYRQDG